MNTIKLNNTTCEVISFNKNTTFNNGQIFGSGNASVRTDNIGALQELGLTEIETIQIFHDEDRIYNLANAGGRVTSIDEYLTEDSMSINVSFSFTSAIEGEGEDEGVEE